MRLKKAVAELIDRERVCRVATAGAGGQPHLVPVCHVVLDGKLYFGSGKKGRKVENLRENPRAAVTVDLYSDAWDHIKGVMIQGGTRLVDGGPAFRKARRALYAKYPHYERDAALDESDSVVVEVTPAVVFTWGLD